MLKKWFGKKDKKEESKREEEQPVEQLRAEEESPEAGSTAAIAPTAPPERAEASAAAETAEEVEHEEPQSEPVSAETPRKLSAWARLKAGLARTRKSLTSVFNLRRALDDDFIDELEAELFAADFGPSAVALLIDGERGVRAAWKSKEIETVEDVREYLKERLRDLLKRRETALRHSDRKPTVILVAGVNGTGKTTSIAKLANRLQKDGSKVVLAAADTFRAAAVEQLTIWSDRIGVEIVTGSANADPASVAYRGAERALEVDADYLIVDTAGRLHTQRNLMRELEKIHDVLGKKIEGAPHESLLVLDATTGQNAIQQAEKFLEAVRVSGIILTKLDGTAKGGIVVTINNRLEIPVKFVGVGESVEDLQDFDPDRFVDALLATEETAKA